MIFSCLDLLDQDIAQLTYRYFWLHTVLCPGATREESSVASARFDWRSHQASTRPCDSPYQRGGGDIAKILKISFKNFLKFFLREKNPQNIFQTIPSGKNSGEARDKFPGS
jgi:hypothetical protein